MGSSGSHGASQPIKRAIHERVRYKLGLCAFGPWHHLRLSVSDAEINGYDHDDNLLGSIPHHLCKRHLRETVRAFKQVPHRGRAEMESGAVVSWSTENDEGALVSTDNALCPCWTCVVERTPETERLFLGMIVCPRCGNKRCPHATLHSWHCSTSNDPGQEGSRYVATP